MIPIINKLFSFITGNFKKLAVIIIMIFSAIFFILHLELKNKNEEIMRLSNNIEYYLDLSQLHSQQNKVLLLTIDDFKLTNDSLVNEVREVLKKLKIKDKVVLLAQLSNMQIVHDTTIVVKEPVFTKEIKPNALTSILINKKDSLLNVKLDIRNTLTLFITKAKEYKRKYKNWFSRLLHFDFKKKTNINYQIHNSNDLIKIDNTLVVEISK